MGNPFLEDDEEYTTDTLIDPWKPISQPRSGEYYKEYRKIISKAMYRTFDADGFFGADMRALCNEHYTYYGDGRYATNWFMIRFNDSVDKFGHKVDPDDFIAVSDIEDFHIRNHDEELADRPDKLCHVLSSMSVFTKPKIKGRGKSLRIDPRDARLDIYCYPVIWKRSKYVNPETYHNMSPEEKRICRTKKTFWKNDYKRKEIYGQWHIERLCSNHGHRLSKEREDEYRSWIKATYVNDVKHPFVGRIGYRSTDVLAITAIVIDLDNHELSSDIVQKKIKPFTRMLVTGKNNKGEKLTDVLPTKVVLTGRGLQLWFDIDPVYGRGISMVRQTTSKLCDVYTDLAAKYCPEISVDRIASMNIAGPKRMPGTKNSHALSQKGDGTYGYNVTKKVSKVLEGQYKITDIMHTLGIPVYAEIKKKENEDKNKEGITRKKYERKRRSAGKRNIRAMRLSEYLQQKAKGMGQGLRNELLFYAGTLAMEDHQDPYTILHYLNSLFSEPLLDSEVDKTARSASKGIYHYSTRRIVETLGNTESDIEPFGLSFRKHDFWVSNEVKKQERKERRDRRNEKILSLLSEGESISATAKILGICRATVSRVKAAFLRKRKAIEIRNRKVKDHLNSILASDLNIDDVGICEDTCGYGRFLAKPMLS